MAGRLRRSTFDTLTKLRAIWPGRKVGDALRRDFRVAPAERPRLQIEPIRPLDPRRRMSRIGLIAGNGRFPFLVLQGARSLGYDVTVVAVKEEAFSELEEE